MLAFAAPDAAAQTAPAPPRAARPAAAPAPPAHDRARTYAPYGYPGQYPYAPYAYKRYPSYPGAAPAGLRSAPRVLRYHEGQRIPPGYYLEDSIRRGPAIAGGIVFGVPYALSLSVGAGVNFSNAGGWLLLPGLGPFITAAARQNTCNPNSPSCNDDASLRTLLVLDGLMQTTGAVLFIWGVSSHKKRLVRDDATYLVVLPRRVGSGYGLGVSGIF